MILSLFNPKAKKAIQGRRKQDKIPPKKKQRAWFHCASLGEFEQGKPIVDLLHDKFQYEVVLTFFSPSGYEVEKKRTEYEHVLYLPFDKKKHVKKFVDQISPDLVFFVKYEFWWNFISYIQSKDIPLFLISASFRNDQYFFKRSARFALRLLHKFDHIFVIDNKSFDILKDRKFNNISLSGDTRIENIVRRKQKVKKLPIIENFKGNEKLLIFGSTYDLENQEVINIADDLIEEFRILIFPHEIHKKSINRLKAKLGKKAQLYSMVSDAHPFTGYEILIVDQIGLLADAYRYSDLSYVGGGFHNGIHNILEPAVYKNPIIFGPNYEKFEEARVLVKAKYATVIEKANQLFEAISSIDIEEKNRIGRDVLLDIFDPSRSPSTVIENYLTQEEFIK